jgi:hypothetical protein
LIIKEVANTILQQDSTTALGNGKTTIYAEGCVLTATVRIANAIDGLTHTLDEANQIAIDNNLYANGDELSPDSAASLIGLLTGKTVEAQKISGTESELISRLNLLKASENEVYVQGRLSNGHQVNINDAGYNKSGSLPDSRSSNQPIIDTSVKGRTSTNSTEELDSLWYFSIAE